MNICLSYQISVGTGSTINEKCASLRRQLLLQLFEFLEPNSSSARLFNLNFKQDLNFFNTVVLQHILSNFQYYGLDLLMQAIVTITASIKHDPHYLSTIHKNGFLGLALRTTLVLQMPLTSNYTLALRDFFVQLCHTEIGLQEFRKIEKPFHHLFRIFTSPTFLLETDYSVAKWVASVLGHSLAALNHQVDLREDLIRAIIAVFKEIAVLGSDMKYIACNIVNYEDICHHNTLASATKSEIKLLPTASSSYFMNMTEKRICVPLAQYIELAVRVLISK